jgi:hypothetical protein
MTQTTGKGKTPVPESDGTETDEQDIEVVRTDELVTRGESFALARDMGEHSGAYGKYHTFLIQYEGEMPKAWNTGAYQVLNLVERYQLPIIIDALTWKFNGVKKTLEVTPSALTLKVRK